MSQPTPPLPLRSLVLLCGRDEETIPLAKAIAAQDPEAEVRRPTDAFEWALRDIFFHGGYTTPEQDFHPDSQIFDTGKTVREAVESLEYWAIETFGQDIMVKIFFHRMDIDFTCAFGRVIVPLRGPGTLLPLFAKHHRPDQIDAILLGGARVYAAESGIRYFYMPPTESPLEWLRHELSEPRANV